MKQDNKILIKNTLSNSKVVQEGSGTIKLNNIDAATNKLDYTLELLKEKFPDKLPKQLLTSEGYARLVGQQEVINYLQNIIMRGE